MLAIMKREFSSYFLSAIGYIILSVFYVFGGFYFYAISLLNNTTSLTYVFNSLFVILIFLIPILTMRLFSEEKKQKTEQALLTAPVNLWEIVLGKYVAALLMFLICIVVTIFYAITISFFNMPSWSTIFGSFIGLFLLGASLISIGMFFSSITENQIIAAVSAIAVGVFILLIDSISQSMSISFIRNILNSVSFMSRYNNFNVGVINLTDVVFFISVCFIFNFLTIRVFEKKRWS